MSNNGFEDFFAQGNSKKLLFEAQLSRRRLERPNIPEEVLSPGIFGIPYPQNPDNSRKWSLNTQANNPRE